jgi:hypothetical protein
MLGAGWRQSLSRVLGAAAIATLGLGACVDKGPPLAEEQMRDLGVVTKDVVDNGRG